MCSSPSWAHAFPMCRGHQDPLAAEERRWVMGWESSAPDTRDCGRWDTGALSS